MKHMPRRKHEFCKSKGGHLPTLNEICPKGEGKSPPALGCAPTHSWVPYSKNSDSWVYIGCSDHALCRDHVKYYGSPKWDGVGDIYGDEIECIA